MRTLADILATPAEPLESLPFLGRDNVLIRGWSHLLASAVRAGKSELVSQAMIPWLAKGLSILWLSEETESNWRDRVDDFNGIFGSRIPWHRVGYEYTLTADPRDLLRLARSSGADVIVADTLRNVCRIEDENSAAAVRAAVGPWIAQTKDSGQTFIALVHHRKQPSDTPGGRVAGSHALPGLFDVVLELDRVPLYDNRRLLSGLSRRHKVNSLVVELNDEQRMVVLGDGRSVSRADTGRRCADAVLAAAEPLTTRQVRAAIGPDAPSLDTVARALARLARDQAVWRSPDINEEAAGRTVTWTCSPPLL